MAKENGNATEKKATELKSVFVEIYPDWEGVRTVRDLRYGDKEFKFTIGLPVPKTDEEAKNLYNVGIDYFIAKGVKQHSYDSDTNLSNILANEVKKGTKAETLASVVAENLETDLIYSEPERKTTEASELKAAKAELGMSLAEMIALAKKVKSGQM